MRGAWRRRTLLALLVVAGSGITVACAREQPADAPVLAFAASSLREAFVELAVAYRAAGGDSVVPVFGSTGDLAVQITNGAPADVFFAADTQAIADLAARGLVDDGTCTVYAVGRLALVARCENAGEAGARATGTRATSCPVLALGDLTAPAIRTIAIADPSHAPYGLAARQALERSGLWAAVQPRLVFGANIAQAEQFVATGNADAGFVALSLVVRAPGRSYTLVDSTLYDPLRHAAAVVAESPRREAAAEFLRFVSGEEGQGILARYGLAVLASPSAAP